MHFSTPLRRLPAGQLDAMSLGDDHGPSLPNTGVLRGCVPDLDPHREHARRIVPFFGSLIEKVRHGR
jgi:hypothetical protein